MSQGSTARLEGGAMSSQTKPDAAHVGGDMGHEKTDNAVVHAPTRDRGVVSLPHPKADQIEFLSSLHSRTENVDTSAIICGPRKQ
jgi:hypothetical protein